MGKIIINLQLQCFYLLVENVFFWMSVCMDIKQYVTVCMAAGVRQNNENSRSVSMLWSDAGSSVDVFVDFRPTLSCYNFWCYMQMNNIKLLCFSCTLSPPSLIILFFSWQIYDSLINYRLLCCILWAGIQGHEVLDRVRFVSKHTY